MGKPRITIVDTSVILRYLLKDHPEFYKRALEFFTRVKNNQVKAFIPSFIIAEAVYVLKGFYNVPRKEVSFALTEILKYRGIVNKEREIIIKALDLYSTGKLDFADCLLLAWNRLKGYDLLTFDQDVEKSIE